MRIPEIRAELATIATRLTELSEELKRRPMHRNGRQPSTPMSDQVRAQIWKLHRARPELTQMEIAEILNVNPGRVSETLKGYRK